MRVLIINCLKSSIYPLGTLLRQIKRQTGPWLVVFAYHGVTPHAHVPRLSYGLHLHEADFARHCKAITTHFETCHVEEFLRRSSSAQNKIYALLTFDDVYDNVITTALPILESYRLKFMLFLTTDYIGSPELFWWDRVRFAFLATPAMSMNIADRVFELHSLYRREQSMFAFEVYLAGLSAEHREALVRQVYEDNARYIRNIFDKSQLLFAPITHRSLEKVKDHPLCEIGLHSASHPALPDLPLPELAAELSRSQAWYYQWRRRPARDLCYPFGVTSKQVDAVARSMGFRRGFILDNRYPGRFSAARGLNREFLTIRRYALSSRDMDASIIHKAHGYYDPLISLFGMDAG